jgi:hypothetical protein
MKVIDKLFLSSGLNLLAGFSLLLELPYYYEFYVYSQEGYWLFAHGAMAFANMMALAISVTMLVKTPTPADTSGGPRVRSSVATYRRGLIPSRRG